MHYAAILASIDDEIDRLQRARDLLAGSYAFRNPPEQKATISKKKIKTIKTEPLVSEQPSPMAEMIQKVPYRNRTKSRRTARPSKPLITATALSRHVPFGPVVVSADEASKARIREKEQMRSIPIADNHSSERSLGSLIRALPPEQIPREG